MRSKIQYVLHSSDMYVLEISQAWMVWRNVQGHVGRTGLFGMELGSCVFYQSFCI